MNIKTFQHGVGLGSILLLGLFLFGFDKREVGTEQGHYLVAVESLTNPIKVGRNTMKLTIKDKNSGKPAGKKLTIEVIPWMPAHEHGTSEVPIIKETRVGEYLIERLTFTMPGDWEVYIRLREGRREDTAVFNVSVK